MLIHFKVVRLVVGKETLRRLFLGRFGRQCLRQRTAAGQRIAATAVQNDRNDDTRDAHEEVASDVEVKNEVRADGADDEGDTAREPAQDVVGVLDGHRDEKAAKRVGHDHHPSHDAKAVQPALGSDKRVLVQAYGANRNRAREEAELDVPQPQGT